MFTNALFVLIIIRAIYFFDFLLSFFLLGIFCSFFSKISSASCIYCTAPLLSASYFRILSPKLGASLRRVFLLMIVSKTISGKCELVSSTTWLESLRRESNIVRRSPSMSKLGLWKLCMFLMVFRSFPSPSNAKYSH